MKTFVFDFDGVIADTFESYAHFLSRFMKMPLPKARKHIKDNSFSNTKQSFIKIVIKNFYMRKFEKYLLAQSGLLHLDVIEEISRLPGDKYIISRNHSQICQDLLGSSAKIFKDIYGYNSARSKIAALQDLTRSYKTPKESICFVTDTLGDYKEVIKYLDNAQIWIDTWGFNTQEEIQAYSQDIQLLYTPLDIRKLCKV